MREPIEKLAAVRAYAEGALDDYGQGDYYLGRDRVAEAVLAILNEEDAS